MTRLLAFLALEAAAIAAAAIADKLLGPPPADWTPWYIDRGLAEAEDFLALAAAVDEEAPNE